MKKSAVLFLFISLVQWTHAQTSLDSLSFMYPKSMQEIRSCDITTDKSKFLYTDGSTIIMCDLTIGRVVDQFQADFIFDVIWSWSSEGIGVLSLPHDSSVTNDVVIYSIFNQKVLEKIRLKNMEVISVNDINKSIIIRNVENEVYLLDLINLESSKIDYNLNVFDSHNYCDNVLSIFSRDKVYIFSKEMSVFKFNISLNFDLYNGIFDFNHETSNFLIAKGNEIEIIQYPENKSVKIDKFTDAVLFAELNRNSGELLVNCDNVIYLYSYPKYELSRIIDLPIVSDEFNFIGYYGSEGGILASTNNGVYLLSDYKNGWEDYIDLWNDNQYLELGFFQEYYSQNGSEVLLIERNTEFFFSPLIFNTHSDTFISLNSKSLIPEELDFSNFDDDYTLNLIDNLKQEMQVYSLPNFKGLQSSTFSRSQDCGYYVEGEFALFGLKNSLYHKEFVTNPIIYSTKDSSVVKSFDGQYLTCMLSNNSMSRDVKLCTINSLGKLDLFNITQDSLIYSSEGFFDVVKSGFSDNGMELYLNRKSGILDVFDLSNLELKELSSSINSNFVISLKKVPKFNLISIAYPGEVHFLSTSSGDILWRMYFFENEGVLIRLSNSPYYMSSKDVSKMLHYVTPSLKVIGFDQLDPIYNRPDIVLDSIGKYFGGADEELVTSYRLAWEKRVEKLGVKRDLLATGEIAVPKAEIANAEQIQYENKGGKLIVHIKANDPKYPLQRYNVLVNEVPVYGSVGISIAGLHTQTWERTDTITLSKGRNKIQVSVMNELGLENFKYPTYVNYNPEEEVVSTTYFVGIGVDQFQQDSYNLDFCVKDVTDLAEAFAAGGVTTDTLLLTNGEVTRENLHNLKSRLMQTTVNDKVIISCSSHGLIADNKDFYLATHDMDFENPSSRGFSYQELESLLDSIPARQKLLLLDACNSGEIYDDEPAPAASNENDNKPDDAQSLADNGSPRSKRYQMAGARQRRFIDLNEAFVNVRNNTGSVIISAAGGRQSAQEGRMVDGKKIENGAFTFSVLECLEQHKGRKLNVSTLKQYAERRVEEITNGEQKPTSRQETMEVDWLVY